MLDLAPSLRLLDHVRNVLGGADLAEEVEEAAVVGGLVEQHGGVDGAGIDPADATPVSLSSVLSAAR